MSLELWGDTLSSDTVTRERAHRHDGSTLFGTVDLELRDRRPALHEGCLRPSLEAFLDDVRRKDPNLLRTLTRETIVSAWRDLPAPVHFRRAHVDDALQALSHAAGEESGSWRGRVGRKGGGRGQIEHGKDYPVHEEKGIDILRGTLD